MNRIAIPQLTARFAVLIAATTGLRAPNNAHGLPPEQ